MKKSFLPTKVCKICGFEFSWRKKWEKNWENVKYCSKKCSKKSPSLFRTRALN
jgi:hypothetical protein